MAVIDTDMIRDLTYRLLENGNADATGAGLLSTMFSIPEIIDSMNRVQQDFLLETGMIVTRASIVPAVGQSKYNLPADSIRPRRVTWQEPNIALGTYGSGGYGAGGYGGSSIGSIRCLTQVDTWELDNGMHRWPTDRDIPIAWWETTLPQQQIGIAKTPSNNGVIGLLYVALAQTLTGAGITFAVPDDWTPYILYGTLAELLSSDGASFDPVRAGYCTTRYQEGIELARIVLGGT